MPLATNKTDSTISLTDHPGHHNALASAVNKGGADMVRLAADAALSSTTLTNLTGMSFSVAATTAYAYEFWIPYRSATLTVGKGFAVTVPAGFTLLTYAVETHGFAADGAASSWHGVGTTSGDAVVSTATVAINTTYLATLKGLLTTGATAGLIQLQHSSETATSTTVMAGAVGWLRTLT